MATIASAFVLILEARHRLIVGEAGGAHGGDQRLERLVDEIKMTGTPTFVIDGKVFGGELTIDQLKAILDPLIKK